MSCVKEAIIIIFEIGDQSSKTILDDGSKFFDMSKKCIERIIERKIFSSAGDEIGLILLGTQTAANSLQYNYISEAFRMANPSWEMLKIIKKINSTDIDRCDWIDALVVAMDVLQTQTEGKRFSGKKIVLFVHPENDVCVDKLNTILNGILALEIEITVIGVDLFCKNNPEETELDWDSSNFPDSGVCERPGYTEADELPDLCEKSKKERGEAILEHIVTKCGGIACNFKDALSQLKTYQLKEVKPTPWNATLNIGYMKIYISVYKKTAQVTLPTWQKTAIQIPMKADIAGSECGSSSTIRMEQDHVYMRDDRSVVAKEDRIAGYYFGSTIVPFNEFDYEQMHYKSGEKCLNLLGFTKRSNVPRRYFIGDGIYYVTPQKKYRGSAKAFVSLINALHKQEKVAIATKVYRKDATPSLVALFPLLKKNYKCMLLAELPFSEDVNEFVFPRVVPINEEPNAEELDAVGNLMDAMNLMEVENDGIKIEAFHLKDIVDPAIMHQFRCVAHRALQPEEPLPSVSDDIKELLTCPFLSQENFKMAVEGVKEKFKIVEQPEMSSIKNEVKLKDRTRKENIPPQQSTSSDGVGLNDEISLVKVTLVEVGSAKPDEDFIALISRGEPFNAVCEQMQNVILKMVLKSFGSNSFPKALRALFTLRKSCVEKNPTLYNNWLPNFKNAIEERGITAFWELVVEGGLVLISSEETPLSLVSKEEASLLFKEPESGRSANDSEEVDIDDLIAEM